MDRMSPDLLWPAKEAVGRILEEHKPKTTPIFSEWCDGCEDDHFRECRTLRVLFGVEHPVWDLEEWLYRGEGAQ